MGWHDPSNKLHFTLLAPGASYMPMFVSEPSSLFSNLNSKIRVSSIWFIENGLGPPKPDEWYLQRRVLREKGVGKHSFGMDHLQIPDVCCMCPGILVRRKYPVRGGRTDCPEESITNCAMTFSPKIQYFGPSYRDTEGRTVLGLWLFMKHHRSLHRGVLISKYRMILRFRRVLLRSLRPFVAIICGLPSFCQTPYLPVTN